MMIPASSVIQQHPSIGTGAAGAPMPTERSECPPPLMWADVLSRVEAGVEEFRVSRAGCAVTVRAFGDGKPLFVLPGALGDWRLLSLTMWLLRDEFRTVVVDPPLAESGRLPRGRLAAKELAADLFAVADECGHDAFSLFATSLGALPALQAMRAHPARIESAVLHAADSRLRMSVTERRLASLGRFARRTLANLPFFNRIQFHNHRGWFPPFDASRWEFFLENVGRTPTAELCRRLAGLKRDDLTARLGEINTPMLLLRGEGEGTAAAKRVEKLRTSLPNAQERFLPHCGSFPYLTHPHVLANALKEFLSGITP